MSGCIIPIAPDFQDPVASQNYPPYFDDAASKPPFGMIQTISTSEDFTVVAGDLNLTDTLWIQWAIDYPPFNASTTNAIPAMPMTATAGGLLRTATLTMSCNLLLSKTAASLHQLEVIVSDEKPLIRQLGALEDVPDGRFAISQGWPFYLPCDGTPAASP